MAKLPLEDEFNDILKKAIRGLNRSSGELAQALGVDRAAIKALTSGEIEAELLRSLAPLLGLSGERLLAVARAEAYPQGVAAPPELTVLTTPFPESGYPDMTVNAYLVLPPDGNGAVAFDTGMDAAPILAALEGTGRSLEALFLTHTHRDHVGAYDALVDATGVEAIYVGAKEPFRSAKLVREGDRFEFGGCEIEARLTHGHSPGGMSYLLSGLTAPTAVVGDSLFALSQGGVGPEMYAAALANNREKLLDLDRSTVLCPGHGPLTTVAFERSANPFFPDLE